MGDSKTTDFNTKMVIHDLDDLGVPPFQETTVLVAVAVVALALAVVVRRSLPKSVMAWRPPWFSAWTLKIFAKAGSRVLDGGLVAFSSKILKET